MGDYFRRSRTGGWKNGDLGRLEETNGHQGCMNCRAIRTKCDEQKPECHRCIARGLVCKPYTKKLRWVVESSTTQLSARDRRPSQEGPKKHPHVDTEHRHVSCGLQASLSPPCHHPLDSLDRPLFEHWMAITLHLVCLDPVSSENIQRMYLHLATSDNSVALRAMLANSAAHLLSLGRISDSKFALVQQRAFKSLRVSLNKPATKATMLTGGKPTAHCEHIPLPSLADDTVVGSTLLLGDEIIRPDDHYSLGRVQYLLRGTYSLVVERHKYFDCTCSLPHLARFDPEYKLDSPVFVSSVRLLAWGDIMSCVPCVRPPLIDNRYWLDGAVKAAKEGARHLRPDFDLGYCAEIVALLGQCATAIHGLYTESLSDDDFSHMQDLLCLQLDKAIANVPEIACDHKDNSNCNQLLSPSCSLKRESVHAHNDCVRAAICHGLATQIFLLRATDHHSASSKIQTLRNLLWRSISRIPTYNSVVTIMLWPLWVLGCESYHTEGTDDSRQFVATFLQEIYERQAMRSVQKCLTTLQDVIWKLDPPESYHESKYYCPMQQPTWVRYCWSQKIELLLA